MINSLVITNNLDFVVTLIDVLDDLNFNMRVKGISDSDTKTYKLLDNKYFDLVLLDRMIADIYDEHFLRKHNIVILSTYELKTCSLSDICNKLFNLNNNLTPDIVHKKIIDELTYIGYNFKYIGTEYLVNVIQELYFRQNTLPHSLHSCIYPVVAHELNKSVKSIKNGIVNCTEYMYRDCNIDTLKKYFDFPNDIKPTIKQVTLAVLSRISS